MNFAFDLISYFMLSAFCISEPRLASHDQIKEEKKNRTDVLHSSLLFSTISLLALVQRFLTH